MDIQILKVALLSIIFASFYLPVLNIPLIRIEVDANFYYRLATESEALAIVFEVDLLHRRLRILVHLHLYYIEICAREHHDVNPTMRSMHLHIYQIISEQREDDVEHLLLMTLITRIIAIRHGTQVGLEQLQSSLHILLGKALGYATCRIGGSKGVRSDV